MSSLIARGDKEGKKGKKERKRGVINVSLDQRMI